MGRSLEFWVEEAAPDLEEDWENSRGSIVRAAARTDRMIKKALDVGTLQASFEEICAGLEQVFHSARQVGEFRLTEVTVGVEVGAEGGFELIGTGKVSGKGSITLKFEDKSGK